MKQVVYVISNVIIVEKPFAQRTMERVLCNGNTGLEWQCGCMVKVNINL